MSGIVTGADADFSEERLINYYNTWLANSIGNLLNRTLNMLQRYCAGRLPIDFEQARIREPQALAFIDNPEGGRAASHGLYRFSMDSNNPADALAGVEQVARDCNELIEKRAPWALAKDEGRRRELEAVLVLLAEASRIVAMRLSPILPSAAMSMLDQLDPTKAIKRDFDVGDVLFEHFAKDHVVGKPVPLFPRIETIEKSDTTRDNVV
jgi:methionyl-tRNA synthetase